MNSNDKLRIYIAGRPGIDRERIAAVLGEHGDVVEWDTGERFLSAVLQNAIPDLAFVSDTLPDLSAVEICRRLSLEPVQRSLPVVLLAPIADEAFVQAAMSAGAADILNDPVNLPLLRARLKSYLALRRETQALSFEAKTRSEELERLVDTIRTELTERERTMARAEFLFSHDLVTGLPNRRQLIEQLERTLRRVEADGQPLALVGLEIEHFNQLQASLGAEQFDRLIAAAAVSIQQTLRPMDLVARIGDDLFAAILFPREIDSVETVAANAREAATRAAKSMRDDLVLDGKARPLVVRSAISVFPSDGMRAGDLLRHLEATLAIAHGGTTRRRATTPDLAAALALELRLRQAIENDRLVPYYQPKIDVNTRRVIGGEALIRWPLRSGEFVGPQEFVPVAETGGLVPQLDDYVLTAACCQIAEWQEQFSDFRVAVNLSALKLHHRGILERVRELLAVTGARAEHLELEITESALITDFDAARAWLSQVRDLGVTVALDDFGTGYSSLAYLRRLPLDSIKIDQSFIMGLEHEAGTAAIVRAMIAMARALGLGTIAEGVETMRQAEILTDLGCESLQGFLFSAAVPAKQFETVLQAGRLDPRAMTIRSPKVVDFQAAAAARG
ncbi:MAG TPA: EAL domain-containing protein [Nevskiaceae bacterium]|nr:EAL domain-containing protein [Nevskiaceae bacterium]